MKLPSGYITRMVIHATREAPRECCGIIAGKDGVVTKLYKARNASESVHQYVLHPTDLRRIYEEIMEKNLDIIATYHSHPQTAAYPSEDDITLAIYDVPYIIVSLEGTEPDVRAFVIRNGIVTEEPIAGV